jgi:hypothetical protein
LPDRLRGDTVAAHADVPQKYDIFCLFPAINDRELKEFLVAIVPASFTPNGNFDINKSFKLQIC